MIFTATEQLRTSEQRRNRQIKLLQQTDGFVNGQSHHAAVAAVEAAHENAAYALYAVSTRFVERLAACDIGVDLRVVEFGEDNGAGVEDAAAEAV